MTRTHELKIYKQYADAIVDGRKTFEVRLNDRGYNAGDIVVFEVIDECQNSYLTHPLRGKEYRIDYIHSGLGMEKDYVVFSIKPNCVARMDGESDE